MLTRAEAIAACNALPDVFEDYPFHDPNWTVMRHRSNKKTFALIFKRQGRIWINLKAQPEWVRFWQGTYAAAVPAYHMNKEHWFSVILDGTIPDGELARLIAESHALTAPAVRPAESAPGQRSGTPGTKFTKP